VNKQKPPSQRAIERAIRAALATGLKVVAVRLDGMVFTEMPADEVAPDRATPPVDDVADDL
jgi:hypothetical protein